MKYFSMSIFTLFTPIFLLKSCFVYSPESDNIYLLNNKQYCVPKENGQKKLVLPPVTGYEKVGGEHVQMYYECKKRCGSFPVGLSFFVEEKKSVGQGYVIHHVKDLLKVEIEGVPSYYQDVVFSKKIERLNDLFMVDRGGLLGSLIFPKNGTSSKENFVINDDDLFIAGCYLSSNGVYTCLRRFYHGDLMFMYYFDYSNQFYDDIDRMDQEIVKKFKSLECQNE